MKTCYQFIRLLALLFYTALTVASPGHSGGHNDIPVEDLPWAAPFASALVKNPITPNSSSLVKGEKLYRQHCSRCHGLTGETPYQTGKERYQLSAITANREPGDLAWKISEGRGEMPSMKNKFSADDIWNVVNFLQQRLP
jgi:mono/diheme cytochrome c family protein